MAIITTEQCKWTFAQDELVSAEMVASGVPLTAKEAEHLREAGITLKPTRKQLGAGAKPKK